MEAPVCSPDRHCERRPRRESGAWSAIARHREQALLLALHCPACLLPGGQHTSVLVHRPPQSAGREQAALLGLHCPANVLPGGQQISLLGLHLPPHSTGGVGVLAHLPL
jgi:hypothetical protein